MQQDIVSRVAKGGGQDPISGMNFNNIHVSRMLFVTIDLFIKPQIMFVF